MMSIFQSNEPFTLRQSMKQIFQASPINSRVPSQIQKLVQLLGNRISQKFQKFVQAYVDFDLNKNGKITPQEFVAGIQRLGMGDQMNHQEIAQLFAFLDSRRRGFLDYQDFSQLTGQNIQLQPIKPQINGKSKSDEIQKPLSQQNAAGLQTKHGDSIAEILKAKYDKYMSQSKTGKKILFKQNIMPQIPKQRQSLFSPYQDSPLVKRLNKNLACKKKHLYLDQDQVTV